MERETFIQKITERLSNDPGIDTLFLGGSLGSGLADRFSDIDLLALPKGDAGEFADRWPGILGEVAEIVMIRRMGTAPRILFNAVTVDWMRCDLYLTIADDLSRRPKGGLKPLIDPHDMHAEMPDAAEPRPIAAARLTYMIEEHLRILGLIPVALGRGELVTAVQGAGFQRDSLVQLMQMAANVPADGGLLRLSRDLPAAEMEVLMALPAAQPDPGSLLATHRAISDAFLPRARKLAEQAGVTWPAAFEDATRRHLVAELGVDLLPVMD